MKAQACILIINTANGYCFTPEKHKSVNSAVNAAKESAGFAYRIFNATDKRLIKRGFC